MINFSNGISHLYLPKLNEVNQNISFGINYWLQNSSDYYISQNQKNNDFTVCTYDYFDFLKPYAFDINRVSCASIESLKDIEKKTWQPKFIGWNITKFYYSAFFSAHCILKITGNSISNIENSSLEKIKTKTKLYNFSHQNLNSGLYCVEFVPTNNFRFFKSPQYDHSHEGLWKYFLDFLNKINPSIYHNLPQFEAQKVVDKLEELIEALTNWNSTNGNWLSRIRNLVNYSHSHGLWFPYKEYRPEYDNIYNFLNLHLSNPLDIDLRTFRGQEILYFVRTCQLINSIAIDLLSDLSTKHPKNKSFISNGILKFKSLYL